MPTTVTELAAAASLRLAGVVRWGDAIALDAPGVYVVARTPDPDDRCRPSALRLSTSALDELLTACPALGIDGRRPSRDELGERLSGSWLPDEVALYVGRASTSVRKRVRQYYRTPLGARKPHAGGWFLKCLTDLEKLFVHYAPTGDPKGDEDVLLRRFCAGVSDASREALADPEHPFPFANLEWPPGTKKRHGISGARAASRQ
jgi:hypothetical protein